jgi:hypothetical protein
MCPMLLSKFAAGRERSGMNLFNLLGLLLFCILGVFVMALFIARVLDSLDKWREYRRSLTRARHHQSADK